MVPSVLQTTALGILFCGTDVMSFSSWKRRLSKLVINPLDGRNTEKPKTSFFMKKSKNNNIILGFSFTYLVLFYPMDLTKFSNNIFFYRKPDMFQVTLGFSSCKKACCAIFFLSICFMPSHVQ